MGFRFFRFVNHGSESALLLIAGDSGLKAKAGLFLSLSKPEHALASRDALLLSPRPFLEKISLSGNDNGRFKLIQARSGLGS